MKPTTLKTYLDVHTWAGLAAGLALFIAFYAGAITVFTHEVDSWDQYSVAAAPEQDLTQAQQLLDQVLATQPVAGETLRVNLSSDEHPGNAVLWYEKLEDGSYERHEFQLEKSGALSRVEDTSALAAFVYALHYNLGIPGPYGLYILGVICFIYGLALVSGVVIFLPNFMKDLFVVRPGNNKKRFWLDAHNAVGVMSLPWHVMFAWSSAILALGIYMLAPFQLAVFDQDITQMLGPELGLIQTPKPSGESGTMLDIPELVAAAQTVAPGLEVSQVRFLNVGDSNAAVRIIGATHTEHIDAWANVMLMARNGEVVSVNHPATDSAGASFYRGLLALHFVSFGGYLAKWIYFVLGLAGAFLFYSGNLLWVESRRKRRQPQQAAAAVFLARLNSGVCIGCMAGISAAFLASRGLAHLADRAQLMAIAYFAVFFAAIAWCFLRPVAAATRDLLYISALLTAAIPVFDLIFLDTTALDAAVAGHFELAAVATTALLAAVVFWCLGRAVQKRSRLGDPNSVWAVPQRQQDTVHGQVADSSR